MQVYAVKHKDEKIRTNSRSGGIFTAISDQFLNGGVVYGCVLNGDLDVCHVRTESKAGRDKMRGSKYVQSRMGDCFRQIKNDLENGKKVLFSGTSCQVSGLRCFLQKEYDNLFCLDIVCHGVPSPRVWRDYVKWWEQKNGKIDTVDFRNKEQYGWADHVESIYFGSGRKKNSRVFTSLFYGHNCLRPSCYECPYKQINHPGDITIADYWGIDKAAPGFSDNKGVSLVLVNSEKGAKAFELAKKSLVWKETRIEDSMQPPLRGPFKKPQGREKFWKDYAELSFQEIAEKYGRLSIKGRLQNLKKSLVKKKRVLFKQM